MGYEISPQLQPGFFRTRIALGQGCALARVSFHVEHGIPCPGVMGILHVQCPRAESPVYFSPVATPRVFVATRVSCAILYPKALLWAEISCPFRARGLFVCFYLTLSGLRTLTGPVPAYRNFRWSERPSANQRRFFYQRKKGIKIPATFNRGRELKDIPENAAVQTCQRP